MKANLTSKDQGKADIVYLDDTKALEAVSQNILTDKPMKYRVDKCTVKCESVAQSPTRGYSLVDYPRG